MHRYVILKHDWEGEHFDLMLEHEGMLDTWRMLARLMSGQQSVMKLSAHRLDYLRYEGPVSGNRGVVSRIASGEYTVLLKGEGSLQVRLIGDCSGELALEQEDGNQWRLTWKPD